MRIISGTALSKEIKNTLSLEIKELRKQYGRVPKLALVLVDNNPDSAKYVNSKKRICEEIGMEGEIRFLPVDVSQHQLLQLIDQLNQDPCTDGILLQLPLPGHLNTEEILTRIHYRKDADGLHPINMGKLFDGSEGILPCTAKGIISLLKYGEIEISGKHAVVLGRSNLVGKPTAQLLLRENATVTICHTGTKALSEIVKTADILVLAMGNPNVITPEMLKPGVVLVDVAMNWINNKLGGDIYFDRNLPELEKIAFAATPVPGGVGPMTIISLIENCVEIFKKSHSQ